MLNRYACLVFVLFGLGLIGCQEFMTPVQLPGGGSGAQAQAGAPASAQVAMISIPFDPSLPNSMVTVEPFQTAAQDITSGGNTTPQAPNQSFYYSSYGHNEQGFDRPERGSSSPILNDRTGVGVAVQLLSTLARVGNITVIDYETYRGNPGVYPNIYVIKGTVTEFSETAEAQDQKKGFTTLPGGMILHDIGQAVGSGALSLAGNLTTHSNVASQETATNRKGMVGLDIQIVRSGGVIITSFPCQGTFVTQSATKANTALGFGMSSSAYQASAIGQAQRAALNDAATQISSALRTRGR